MIIHPAELKERLSHHEALNLIDVREPVEFSTFNIGGTNIPLQALHQHIDALKHLANQEIIVLCQRGLRSQTAQKLLIKAGFTSVKNLEGGLLAYNRINS